MDIEKLKTQSQISRTNIANLLKSIGKPGEKREEKITAVSQLDRKNTQNIKLEDSLASYEEW